MRMFRPEDRVFPAVFAYETVGTEKSCWKMEDSMIKSHL